MTGEDEPVFVLRAQDRLAESANQICRLLAEAQSWDKGPVLTMEIDRCRQWHGERRLPHLAASGEPAEMGHVAPASRLR